MTERKFSKKCGRCRKRTMALAEVPYTIQIDHDGRKYTVHLDALSAPRCSDCKNIVIDAEAERRIDEAFRRQAKLLTPGQIRQHRERLGLTQKQLADYLCIGEATLSRWETGAQVQQRAMNLLLNGFFNDPAFRVFVKTYRDSDQPAARDLAPAASLQATNTTPNTTATPSVVLRTFVNTPYVNQLPATTDGPTDEGAFILEPLGG